MIAREIASSYLRHDEEMHSVDQNLLDKLVAVGDLDMLGELLASGQYTEYGDEKSALKDWIVDYLAELGRTYGDSASQILFEIALWARYALYVQKDFIARKYSEGSDILQRLIKAGYVQESLPFSVTISNSARAEYIVNAVGRTPQGDLTPSAANSIRTYIQTKPDNLSQILRRLRYVKELLQIIQQDEETIASIFSWLRNTTSVCQLSEDVFSLTWKSDVLSGKVESFLKENLDFICDLLLDEQELKHITFFLSSIPWKPKAKSRRKIADFRHKKLGSETEDNEFKCRWQLSWQENSALNLDNSIDEYVPCHRSPLCKEPVICGKSKHYNPNNIAKDILEHLGAEVLRDKLLAEEDLYQVACAFSYFCWYAPEVSLKVADGIDERHIIDELKSQRDTKIRSFCEWGLRRMRFPLR
jgi:hypothetical protein